MTQKFHSRCIIGIDPGMNTGIAFMTNASTCYSYSVSRDEIEDVLVDELKTLYFDYSELILYVEKQQPMMSRDFQVGVSFGQLQMLLRMINKHFWKIPHIYIPIKTWQLKVLGKTPKGQTKQYAKEYVENRFGILTEKKRTEHENDAICIATYGWDKE